MKVPEIGTQAFVDSQKEIIAEGEIVIEDTVSYTNLTPGKEYTVKGILMDKATGEPLSMVARSYDLHSLLGLKSLTVKL